MPGKPPHFPMYARDFVADGKVVAMTTEQVGAYALLLCYAWLEEPAGSIPDDDTILSRWTKLSARRWQSIKPGVLAAFELRDGRYFQKRMVKEFKTTAEAIAKARSNGRKGAKARWQNRGDPNGDPMAGYANATPITPASGSDSGSSTDLLHPETGGGGTGAGETEPAARLAQIWAFHCTRKRHGMPQDTASDMLDNFRELMRHGLSFDAIHTALIDPKRRRDEYFWQLRNRLTGSTNGRSGQEMGPTSRVRAAAGKYDGCEQRVDGNMPADVADGSGSEMPGTQSPAA